MALIMGHRQRWIIMPRCGAPGAESKFTVIEKYNQNSQNLTVFHAFPALAPGAVYAGYAALIAGHALLVPLPDSLCAISARRRKYAQGRWRFFTPRHQPDETLQGQLTFALKYEGARSLKIRVFMLSLLIHLWRDRLFATIKK